MTNASRENSILRFQPFALRLHTDIEMRVNKKAIKNYPQHVGQERATKPRYPSYAPC